MAEVTTAGREFWPPLPTPVGLPFEYWAVQLCPGPAAQCPAAPASRKALKQILTLLGWMLWGTGGMLRSFSKLTFVTCSSMHVEGISQAGLVVLITVFVHDLTFYLKT